MHVAVLALALAFTNPPPIQDAQEPASGPPMGIEGVQWIVGPAEGRLGDRATVAIPEGCRFTDGDGTRTVLAAMQNPPSGSEVGLLLSGTGEKPDDWFVVFDFSDSGYVKDEDRDELDAAALLESMQEGTKAGNEERKRMGWPTIELVGWQREPFYDARTNNLTWAKLLRSESGGQSVNWSVRVLGREGVMHVDLVINPESLDAALPAFEKVMDSFQYADGQRYAQFTAGDKIAEYGLAALVLGGGAAVAAKTGLLAKFWKVILFGLAGIAAAGKKLWGWMTGRRETTPDGEAS